MKARGEILASILKNFGNCYFFLHNTRELNVAENILKSGFIFENQLLGSTDRVNPGEPIEITYFLLQRKDYGSFTIVIAIPKVTYISYSAFSAKYGITIEEAITSSEPYFGDNDELMYTISPGHILGYFDINTSQFIQNSDWDPFFNNCNCLSDTKRFSRHERIKNNNLTDEENK
jgi:hypothetical protein